MSHEVTTWDAGCWAMLVLAARSTGWCELGESRAAQGDAIESGPQALAPRSALRFRLSWSVTHLTSRQVACACAARRFLALRVRAASPHAQIGLPNAPAKRGERSCGCKRGLVRDCRSVRQAQPRRQRHEPGGKSRQRPDINCYGYRNRRERKGNTRDFSQKIPTLKRKLKPRLGMLKD